MRTLRHLEENGVHDDFLSDLAAHLMDHQMEP
jgi:hypothetical protein